MKTRDGVLPGGIPYVAAGEGPPLVVFPGFAPRNENPQGLERALAFGAFGELRSRYTIYQLARRPGVAEGATVEDFANDYATAIRATFGGPVMVVGVSTGGAAALRLAADHPDLVERLVVAGAAHTFTPESRAAMQGWLDRARQRRFPMQAMTIVLTTSPWWRPLARVALFLLNDLPDRGKDLSDGIATCQALMRFDCADRLRDIRAPMLLILGERDGFVSPAIREATIRGVAGSRLAVYERRGHAGILRDKRFARDVGAFFGRDAEGTKGDSTTEADRVVTSDERT
ncbi:alpha/beta fold hydrolase [Sorangium sp. So ce363]|uniref:alpha/beta fold hydrolase n=1 Tax=Sorangium sp. So ce363 TaxID=3133304 RepID=UPI003F5EBE19